MYCIDNLKIIYEILNESKYELFCKKECSNYKYDEFDIDFECEKDSNEDCNCSYYKDDKEKKYLKEVKIIRRVASIFLEKDFCTERSNECDKSCDCISLLDLLMINLWDIEENTYCKKNYGYLLQIDKLKCILKNFKNLICQLNCLSTKDCDLIAKSLCLLFKIIDLIESIISKINNIECLCNSHICCKCELIECMVCELEDEINCLERTVAELAYIVFDIASKEIINCTTCGASQCIKDKKRDYSNKYCKACYFMNDEACNKKY